MQPLDPRFDPERTNFEESERFKQSVQDMLKDHEDVSNHLTHTGVMRTFVTGATRSSDANKPDFEGFLSPEVLEAYGAYMHQHRKQADGSLRASDNWQKGMSRTIYMKSMFRHFMQLWRLHRGYQPLDYDTKKPVGFREAIFGLLFNVMGYAFEYLKEESSATHDAQTRCA